MLTLLFQMLKMKKHEELETPTFTTSIPIDIVEWEHCSQLQHQKDHRNCNWRKMIRHKRTQFILENKEKNNNMK